MQHALRRTGSLGLVVAALSFAHAPVQGQDLDPLGNLDCGQLGQRPCQVWEEEFWNNGSPGGCDRGLAQRLGSCVNDTRRSAVLDGWASRALRDQRELQADRPLNEITMINAHNAFNTASDGYPFPNQLHSLTDMLDMGARSLSLDLHWFNRALRLCHGLSSHLGCSPVDRPLYLGIEEIDQWLRDPAHADEIVLIDVQDVTDGNGAEMIAPLEHHLSDLILRASEKPAGVWPTLNEIRALGRRVLVLAPNAYGSDLVITGSSLTPGWPNSHIHRFDPVGCGYELDDGYLAIDPTLAAIGPGSYNVSEDSTVYGPFYNGPEVTGVITEELVEDVTRCNVTRPGIDQIDAARLSRAVWSWARDEPDGGGGADCAALDRDGRWRDVPCTLQRPFACRSDVDPLDWVVTRTAGPWSEGTTTCVAEFPGYHFAVPRTGYENWRLAGHGQQVWLHFSDQVAEGDWQAGP